MTTQLASREGSETEVRRERDDPDVLFEEARRRRRRRRMAGGALMAAVVIAGTLTLAMAGGGGGGAHGTAQGHPLGPGSGAGSGHVSATRLYPGAPATERYYTGPGASCPLAPRSRYLPPWSGCVSTMVTDLSGDGRRDLVLVYSRLSHVALRGLPARSTGRRVATRYPALQAMLRVITPAGHITTIPIMYRTASLEDAPAPMEKAAAAALISIAHVSSEPGRTIFLQIDEISSGSTAIAYSLYRGELVSAGAVLFFGGDSGAQAGFQCVAGDPPRLVQRTYGLVRGIRAVGNTVHIYGWWKVSTTTYAWSGPRLVLRTQSAAKRRLLPSDTVGRGCVGGIA